MLWLDQAGSGDVDSQPRCLCSNASSVKFIRCLSWRFIIPELQGLVLARRSLASLELVQVPSTNLHVSLVFIQTFGKAFYVSLAAPIPPTIALISSILALLRDPGVCLLGVCRGIVETTAEEAANCVAYTRTNCYAAANCKQVFRQT